MSGTSPFLKAKQQLLNIEWAKSTSWDVRFLDSDMPNNFKGFFPAISVIEPVFSLEEGTANLGHASLSYVNGYIMPTLSVSFYDDDKSSLERFFNHWVNQEMLRGFRHVAPLEECLKTFEVYRFDSKGNKVWSTKYRVCPRGELRREHSSDPHFIILTVNFIIGSYFRS